MRAQVSTTWLHAPFGNSNSSSGDLGTCQFMSIKAEGPRTQYLGPFKGVYKSLSGNSGFRVQGPGNRVLRILVVGIIVKGLVGI